MDLDLFRGIVPFVVVAEEQSFRKAASRLGVSPAAVSKAVQALEADVGVALLERTSRVVSLTREGKLFFERCRSAAASVEGAREALEATKREPQGELVVSVPTKVEQLEQHDCLMLVGPNGKPRPWLFSTGPMPAPPTLLIDHGPTLIHAALSGLGVAQVFDFMAQEPLRDGRLIEVLAELACEGPPIHAVCAPGRRASPNVRAAFHALADAFTAREA
jgi:DNA-binding transcriptional LysR family regulator